MKALDVLGPFIVMGFGQLLFAVGSPSIDTVGILVLAVISVLSFSWMSRKSEHTDRIPLLSRIVLYVFSLSLPLLVIAPKFGVLQTLTLKNMQCFSPLLWCGIFSMFCFLRPKCQESVDRLSVYFAAMFAGIATCLIVWHIGGGGFAVRHPAPQRFPYTFNIWENYPITRHWFLTFDSRWNIFEEGKFYHAYTPLFVLLHYLILKAISMVTAVGFSRSIRFTPFIVGCFYSMILPGIMAMTFSYAPRARARFLMLVVSATVVTLSIPDLWTGTLFFDADNSYPVAALCQLVVTGSLFAAFGKDLSKCQKPLYALMLFYCLLLPIHAALFGCALLIYALSKKEHVLLLSRMAVFTVICAIIVYRFNNVLGAFAGLEAKGSGFLIRSGLNGATSHYSNVFTSLFAPPIQDQMRIYSFFLFGLIAWFISFILQFFVEKSTRVHAAVFLLFAPVLMDLFIFPESHAVHPYLYDISMSVLGFMSFIFVIQALQADEKYAPQRWYPLVMVIFVGILIHNFTSLIRFFPRF
jgi:hypothetical protein